MSIYSQKLSTYNTEEKDISLYDAGRMSSPSQNINRFEIYKSIQNGAYLEPTYFILEKFSKSITTGWKDQPKGNYQNTKKELLPSVTFSGNIDRSQESPAFKHNGLINLDIDNNSKESLNRFFEWIQQGIYPTIEAAAKSVSGEINGSMWVNCKIEIPTTINKLPVALQKILSFSKKDTQYTKIEKLQKGYHKAITAYFKTKGVVIGKTDDVKRLRYLSHDENIFVNPNAEQFTLNFLLTTLQEITKEEPQHQPVKLQKSVTNRSEVFKLAEQFTQKKGFEFVEGQKHLFLNRFAIACNLLGVLQADCQNYVNANYPCSIATNCIDYPYQKYSKDFGRFNSKPNHQEPEHKQILLSHFEIPENCKYLVICSTLADANTLNENSENNQIHAISTKRMNDGIVAQLRENNRQVFTLFTADKNGQRKAKKLSNAYGLPAIKLRTYLPSDSQFKTVRNFIEQVGSKKFYQILALELDTTHTIQKDKSNPFSIGITNALKIKIDKYIGEEKEHGLFNCHPLDLLSEFIAQNKKLLLQASTGTGKTTGLLQLAFDNDFIDEIGARQTIIFVPSTPIADQLQKKIKKEYGLNTTVVKEGLSILDFHAQEQILICTYQSAFKVKSLVNGAFLIVDEAHTWTDWNFNAEANRLLLEYANLSKRCVLVSATPNLKLTTSIHDAFKFTFCKVEQNKDFAQNIEVTPIFYTGTESDLFAKIQELSTEGKTAIIKKDNLDNLEAFKEIAESKGKSFDIFSSKKRKYKEDSANYNSLIQTGTLQEKPDFLGVTSLMDFGVNFHDEISEIFLINETSKNSIIQLAGRPRFDHKTGKNKTVKVYVFRKAPEAENKPILRSKVTHTLRILEDTQKLWKLAAQNANKHQSTEPITLKKSEVSPVYESKLTEQYEINLLGLLQIEEQREQAETSKEQFFLNLQEQFPHIRVKEPFFLDTQEDKEAQKIKKDLTQQKLNEETEAFITLIAEEQKGEIDTLLESVYHSTADKNLKRKIKQTTTIKKEISFDANELILGQSDIFKNGRFDKHLSKYFKLKSLHIPTTKITSILFDFGAKKMDCSFREFTNSLTCGIENEIFNTNKSRLTGESMQRVKTYKSIIAEFLEEEQELTSKEIKERIQQVTQNKFLTEKKAIEQIKELFNLQKKRKQYDWIDYETGETTKKKKTVYSIVGRFNAFKYLEKIGIDKNEFLTNILNHNIGKVEMDK